MGFRDNLSRKFKEASLPAELTIFEKTDSTNTRAKEYARAREGGHPAFFVASEQSDGRGRLGKSFRFVLLLYSVPTKETYTEPASLVFTSTILLSQKAPFVTPTTSKSSGS